MHKAVWLSVVVPVYNEAENVAPLLQEIVKVLSTVHYVFEVIFVDDGSSDDTLSRLRLLKKEYSLLKVVAHEKNSGQSAALITGIKQAQYPLIVTLDGDGQNDPADIPRLVDYLKDARTVVLGHRIKRRDRRLRKFSSRVGNGIRRLVLGDDCPDTGCSLKLFPREAFMALPHFNHLHRYLPALFKRGGYNQVIVAVNHRPRQHGVSKYGLFDRLRVGVYDLIGVRWLLQRPCSPKVLVYEDE